MKYPLQEEGLGGIKSDNRQFQLDLNQKTGIEYKTKKIYVFSGKISCESSFPYFFSMSRNHPIFLFHVKKSGL